MERFELPVWPGMYEENSHLFIENKLLFSILQVEKEEDSIRLRCRSLEDLSTISEENVGTLDTLFKQVKQIASSDAKRRKKQKEEKPMEKVEENKLHLTVDANLVRLSEIVKLKKLFHKYPGTSPVYLSFQSGGKKVGTVEVESKWGIGWSIELENQLKTLSFIQSFTVDS